MIKSNINIKVTNNLTEDLAKTLKDLASKTVCVGIPEESNVERKDSKLTNAQLLHLHTNGVRDKEMRKAMQKDLDGGMEYSKAHELYIHEYGSPMHSTPPRPVLVPALDDSKEVIAELMRDATLEILDGKDITLELSKVGQEGENIARDWFTDPANNWAPNTSETIAQKGSENPLIDTGELRKSIIYTIRDGDK